MRRPSRSSPAGAAPLLALGDDLCLDNISRREAFFHLYPKPRAGNLLDALEQLHAKPADGDRLRDFVEWIETATRARQPSAGLGEDIRLQGERVVGSGLELDDELLQLCGFTGDEHSGRIVRAVAGKNYRPGGGSHDGLSLFGLSAGGFASSRHPTAAQRTRVGGA